MVYERPAKARRQTFHVTVVAATIDPSCMYIPLGEAVWGYAVDAYEGYTLLLGASDRGDQYTRAARSVYRRRGRMNPFFGYTIIYTRTRI